MKKLQILGNEFSLNSLIGGVEYSLLKGDLSLATLTLKVKQYALSVRKGESSQSDLIPKILKAEVERKEKDALRNRIKRARFPDRNF